MMRFFPGKCEESETVLMLIYGTDTTFMHKILKLVHVCGIKKV